MSNAATQSSNRRVITALFDERSEAERAIERLVSAGIARSDVNLVAGGSSSTSTRTSTGADQDKGFWASLADLFLPDEDRHSYAEGLRRGGHLVTVRTTDALYERAVDILDDEGTVDLDQREASWRSEGWTGYSAGASAANEIGSSTAVGAGASTTTGLGTAGLGASRGAEVAGAAASSRSDSSRSETAASARGDADREAIPIVEENLQVGKRQVNEGRVRVRSYVVEQPVQEQVTLREETVNVERRPVDRPVTDADRLFQDRTIEAETKREEAVVNKEARVKEELVIDKDVQTRTETVSDTVRRTEVEVEDERNRGTGTAGRPTDRTR